MPLDFHKDMDKYLANKRRTRYFSDFKSSVMNKKAVISHKAISNFDKLRNRLASHTDIIKKKKTEEPKEEIPIEQINELVEKKGIERHEKEKIEDIKPQKEGWKEIKIQDTEEKKDLTNLEVEKKKIQGIISKIQEKKIAEKEKLAKLTQENEQRKKTESNEERIKRLELEEELKILKEKQRIEEERLAELRTARRKEQIGALQGRVKQILSKKKSKLKEETKQEEKIKEEAQTQKVEETKKVEQKKPKPIKSFLSRFIQIKTAAEIAREEEERLKQEEEQARKDQLNVNKLLQQDSQETRSNLPPQESEVNLSTLFPGETEKQLQAQEDSIQLDQDYKIKVVKNQ